ncbi:YwqJ-related putative deaminase [Tautonia plasticadhaerens]|uniref:Uncharacterized protein n=1 Tax=Tautonia plasticadhaerens TaxID=2527974 RepID=A0A518GZ02_9BACT|nr:YwqJ-related putative deaminase [Tautonia plasticadhaerens]QDV33752.1 hypothetical protein ElP_16310 [Tautonia plasticadhaerens]
MSEPLEAIAGRIVQLTTSMQKAQGIGTGPVLAVVRNEATGKLYVGLNHSMLPSPLSETIGKAIVGQMQRIAAGQLVVVHSEAWALGGHAEVRALNAAILEREKQLGRKLTETDLKVFEVHVAWLSGKRRGDAAPRCEHCMRLTRGVRVTDSVFHAEGGVSGTIQAPQRGLVVRGDGQVPPAKPAGGEVGPGARPGGGVRGTMGNAALGLLDAGIALATPAIKNWFAENHLKDKWEAQYRDKVSKVLADAYLWALVWLIAPRLSEIRRVKASGHPVLFHVLIDTEWVLTDFGWAATKVESTSTSLLFPGDTPVEWPVWQPKRTGAGVFFNSPQRRNSRLTYDITL